MVARSPSSNAAAVTAHRQVGIGSFTFAWAAGLSGLVASCGCKTAPPGLGGSRSEDYLGFCVCVCVVVRGLETGILFLNRNHGDAASWCWRLLSGRCCGGKHCECVMLCCARGPVCALPPTHAVYRGCHHAICWATGLRGVGAPRGCCHGV